MLWKKNYEIGESKIDSQHYSMFFHVEKLIFTVKNMDDVYYKDECIKTIEFLKNYVDQHFRDEEEYQLSVGYIGYHIHKAQHDAFRNTVAEYERLFNENDFDITLVKSFTGTLLSWLVHHIIDADKRIVTGENPVTLLEEMDRKYTTCYINATKKVMSFMYGVSVSEVKETIYKSYMIGDIFCKIELRGKRDAVVVFSIPEETALNSIKILTGADYKESDEMVLSSLGEVADIISSKVCYILSVDEKEHYSITPPVVTKGKYNDIDDLYDGGRSIILTTDMGKLEILIKEIV